jgi:hypothetical protein
MGFAATTTTTTTTTTTKTRSLLLLLLGVSFVVEMCEAGPAQTATKKKYPDEQLLLARLLSNYDMAARPVFNASKPVNVHFGISFTQICDMDERNQILTTNVWFELVTN